MITFILRLQVQLYIRIQLLRGQLDFIVYDNRKFCQRWFSGCYLSQFTRF